MSTSTTPLDVLSTDCIRMFSADMVQAAKSGHPGAPMGCAPMAHVLWSDTMNYSPSNPEWINRDRFVLSNGHACALQYTMLHLSGYDVTIDDCKKFRQVESKTPGHPENFMTPGVEVCTGASKSSFLFSYVHLDLLTFSVQSRFLSLPISCVYIFP